MTHIQRSAQRFQVLADPIRLKIVLLLGEREMCVGELAQCLGMPQPKVSYHLKRMLEEGLIHRRTEHTWCYYSLSTDVRTWVNREVDYLLKVKGTSGRG
ncbi:MAG: winged helix-turn-helix transcriptional regulator [Firmicutes bacterium]|nr:metalloregulator ArsR/SmtB family transcription factor [Bacillota bacterium]NLO65667.1 winged helix-turn-helix transcriptional regulator [Bacillota bacterium]